MCAVEATHLRSPPQFKELCETKGPADCCPGWSLGGYIGVLHNRSSCFSLEVTKAILRVTQTTTGLFYVKLMRVILNMCNFQYSQRKDVVAARRLLNRCAGFYHSGELTPRCLLEDESSRRACVRVPRECVQHNAVYNILHYLVDDQFMPKDVSN